MTVRPMNENDAADVTLLCAQLGYPATVEQIAARIKLLGNHDEHRMFVAQADTGRIAGWVHVQGTRLLVTEPFAWICGLVVDERHRGRQVGRALMDHAERWARGRGYQGALVYTNIVRTGAHHFYRALGYVSDKTSHVFQKRL